MSKIVNYEPASMSGFLAFEFPCLQYIPRIALRFISPSSSHCTCLPVENTLGGSHCLLNYIQLHSSNSYAPICPMWIANPIHSTLLVPHCRHKIVNVLSVPHIPSCSSLSLLLYSIPRLSLDSSANVHLECQFL